MMIDTDRLIRQLDEGYQVTNHQARELIKEIKELRKQLDRRHDNTDEISKQMEEAISLEG